MTCGNKKREPDASDSRLECMVVKLLSCNANVDAPVPLPSLFGRVIRPPDAARHILQQQPWGCGADVTISFIVLVGAIR
jgi:hypothetical protein